MMVKKCILDISRKKICQFFFITKKNEKKSPAAPLVNLFGFLS